MRRTGGGGAGQEARTWPGSQRKALSICCPFSQWRSLKGHWRALNLRATQSGQRIRRIMQTAVEEPAVERGRTSYCYCNNLKAKDGSGLGDRSGSSKGGKR